MSADHNDNENAKNPAWQTPMELPTAGTDAYDTSMGAPGGTDPKMKNRSTVDSTDNEKITEPGTPIPQKM